MQKNIREWLDSSYQEVKRLFLLMIIQQVMVKSLLILSKNTFFQELKLKIRTSKLMEEIFMISQLMTQLSNTAKSKKYRQDKVMITPLVVCWVLLILKKNYRRIAADIRKQKALVVDSRAIQQIIFIGKIKSTVANTRVIIYYILEQSKETVLQFSKGTTKVL